MAISNSHLGSRATDPSAFVREPFPRIITVAREFGAGGARIAARVAAELGFQLWDDELTTHVARKAGVDPALVRELDERQRDLLDDVLSTSLHGARLSPSKYRVLLTRTVSELAQRGAAVILGRGANFLVSAEQGLRVCVVCPFEQRVERCARRGQVDRERAERLVRSKDRERERFVRQLCGEHMADPAHYDLILNTGELPESIAVQLILAAYQARFLSAHGAPRDESSAPSLRL